MNIRLIHEDEYNQVACIHKRAFKNFFLTELGDPFLRLYYKTIITSPESICVCAVDENNNILGFATGCKMSKGFNKRIIASNIKSYFIFVLRYLLFKPKKIIRLYKNFSKKAYYYDNGEYSELQSIAVLPDYMGQQIGEKLIEEFEKIALKNKIKKIALTTDYYNNDSVIKFYTKNGYSIFYDFYAYPKRRMYKLIKDIV